MRCWASSVYFFKVSTQLFFETFANESHTKIMKLKKVGFCALFQNIVLWISEFGLYIGWANKPQGTNASFKWGFLPELHKEPSPKIVKIILWLCKIYDSYVGRQRNMWSKIYHKIIIFVSFSLVSHSVYTANVVNAVSCAMFV